MIDLPRRLRPPPRAGAGLRDPAVLATAGRSTAGGRRRASRCRRTLAAYRDYIRGSRGEFTVAKDQNVRLRSGWFSDRSAVLPGRRTPVVTQDTGFRNVLPTGAGLFAFRDRDDVLAAFETIEADPGAQRDAALALAGEYFRAETVLGHLMEQVGAIAAEAT